MTYTGDLVERASKRLFDSIGWVRTKLAGNTYQDVSQELVKSHKELALESEEDIDIEDLLEREFVKEHDGEEYRIRFEK